MDFRTRAGLEASLSTTPLASRPKPEPASETDTTFTDKVKMASAANTPFGWIMRSLGESGFTPDPNFKGVFADQDVADYLTKDLDPKYWNELGRAVSIDHAHRIADDFRELSVMRETVDNDGWAGAGANFIAGLLDPINYVTAVATGGIGWVSTGSKIAQLAKAGLVNAGTALATDAAMSAVDPEMTAERMAINAASAFTIGAGIHGLVGAARTASLASKVQRYKTLMESNPAMGAAGQFEFTPEMRAKLHDQVMTEQGRIVFKNELSPEARASLRDELVGMSGLDPTDPHELNEIVRLQTMEPEDFIANFSGKQHEVVDLDYRNTEVPPPETPSTGGDAPTDDGSLPPPRPPKIAGDHIPLNATTFKSPYAARYDLGGRLGRSDSEAVRFISAVATDDALMRTEGGKVAAKTDAATVWHGRNISRFMAERYHVQEALFDEFVKEQRIPWTQKDAARRAFNAAVTAGIRDPEAAARATPQVKKSIDFHKKRYATVRDQGNRHGLDIADAGDNYVNRLYRQAKIADLSARYGDDFIAKDLLGGAIEKAQGIDRESADRLGGWILNVVRNPEHLDELAMAKALGGDEVAIRSVIEAANTGLPPEDIDSLVKGLSFQKEKATTARAKTRTLMDETHSAPAPDGTPVHVDELFENDIDQLYSSYVRQVTGASAERSILDSAEGYFGRTIGSWRELERELTKAGATTTDIDRLDVVRRYLRGMGQRADIQNETVAGVLRMVQKIGMATNGGGFVLANIPDIGRSIGLAGVRNYFKAVSGINEAFERSLTDGRLRDGISDLAEHFGVGVPDRFTRGAYQLSDLYESAAERNFAIGERAVDKFNQVQSAATGLNLANDLTYKIATRAAWHRLHELTAQADTVRESKLLSLGLTREDAKQVGNMLGDKANYTLSRHGIEMLDPAKVKDQQALNKFVVAWHQFVKSSVNKNDIGNLPAWLNVNWVKPLFQFRNYALGAYSTQFLQAVQRRGEAGIWYGHAAVALLASLAYYSRIQIAAQGRADKDEYLAKMLAPRTMIPAIAGNVGLSSIVPPVIDAAWTLHGGHPIFDAARHTGLGSSAGGLEEIMGQIPATAMVNNAFKAYRSIPEAVGGKTFTQGKFRAWRSLVPGQRAPVLRNVLDAIQTRLPEQEDDNPQRP
jgi:hypothetical protein